MSNSKETEDVYVGLKIMLNKIIERQKEEEVKYWIARSSKEIPIGNPWFICLQPVSYSILIMLIFRLIEVGGWLWAVSYYNKQKNKYEVDRTNQLCLGQPQQPALPFRPQTTTAHSLFW